MGVLPSEMTVSNDHPPGEGACCLARRASVTCDSKRRHCHRSAVTCRSTDEGELDITDRVADQVVAMSAARPGSRTPCQSNGHLPRLRLSRCGRQVTSSWAALTPPHTTSRGPQWMRAGQSSASLKKRITPSSSLIGQLHPHETAA